MKQIITKLRTRVPAVPSFILFITLALLASAVPPDPHKTIIWKLKSPKLVGGHRPEILGSPVAVRDSKETALSFNGVNDGLIVPVNPIDNWTRFTVEVLFKPAADGPVAPRFLHFQDKEDNRGTMELRITPEGRWYLDTFLKNGKTGDRLTLIDSLKLHPCDQWHWAALVYDGKKMTSYVNGIKELEGEIAFNSMNGSQISLGVRLNKVNWFKGQISEVRFHPAPLDGPKLQRK